MDRHARLNTHGGRIRKREVKLISVVSGKGGVGKSVLAFNLAERMASMGARVLLVDTDFNCGNVHILANSRCEYGISQFIRGELSLKEAVARVSENLDILPAPCGEVISAEEDMASVVGMMKNLRQQSLGYDLAILDHSSGISKTATVIAHASDLNLLILVPELTSISDCYGLFKHLKGIDTTVDCRLVINRAESAAEAAYIHQKFAALSKRFLGHVPEYLGYVAEDGHFKRSVATQRPLAGLGPESVAVQLIAKIGRVLLDEFGLFTSSSRPQDKKEFNGNPAAADIRG